MFTRGFIGFLVTFNDLAQAEQYHKWKPDDNHGKSCKYIYIVVLDEAQLLRIGLHLRSSIVSGHVLYPVDGRVQR